MAQNSKYSWGGTLLKPAFTLQRSLLLLPPHSYKKVQAKQAKEEQKRPRINTIEYLRILRKYQGASKEVKNKPKKGSDEAPTNSKMSYKQDLKKLRGKSQGKRSLGVSNELPKSLKAKHEELLRST